MKIFRKIVLAVVLAVSILLPNFQVEVSAASYVYNWGERGVVATGLSTAAKSFYTGNYEYSVLSQYTGGSSQSNAPSSALYSQLKSFMTSKHKKITSYAETKEMYTYTDCQNGTGNISSFYSGISLGNSWNGSWNREHTWPNSKGLGGSDENDIMMLRPTSTSENSSRGNTAYGQSSGYYHPNSESNGKYDLRGDVARITLYVYTRWGNTNYMWGKSGVMESLTVLLSWMEQDPVDTWELGRNDAVQSITGTRNVFVDYPEYAWLLFGVKMPTTMATPSGLASNGLAGGGDLPETPGVGGGGSTEDVSDLLAKDTLTIEEAIKIGGTLSHDTTTTKKYYISGTIKDVSNTQYGNMNVQDANGNYIYVYGTYGADGQIRYDALENKPVAGDTVKLYTVVGNYNGAQLKNAWIVERNGNSTGNQGGNEGGGNTNPDDSGSGDSSTVTGSVPSESAKLATFNLGSNVSGHVDGPEGSSYKETNNGYTLNVTNGVKMYPGSADAKGNSCLKLGASKSNGTASFTVPSDVKTVVVYVAQYKANASTIIINGTSTVINTSSDDGAYTAICVDTSTVKTINLESSKRVMINTIAFYGEDNGGTNPDQGGNEGGGNTPDDGGDDPKPPVQNYETITIAQAVEMGSGMSHDTVTDEKYYIYGIIDNIKDTYYGNMTIKDANGNSIYVYGSFDAEGKNYFGYYEYPPVAGDKVKLLTVVGNYNGAQLKNAWILEYGNDVVMPDDFNNGGNEEHKHEYSSKVTAPTCTAGGYTTYTCECGHSYTANEVPANGHDYIEGNCSVCGAEDPNYEGGNQGGNEGGENPDHDSSVCTHEGTDWIVTLQPVVGIDGERYKVCEDCGETIVEKIPALTGGFSGDCNSSLDLGTVGLLLSAVATAVVLKKRK